MAGIYIHIPFCKSRCKYCDFFSTTHLEKRSNYVDAVIREWENYKDQWLDSASNNNIHTIYLGGGTPSLLSDHDLETLLHSILSSINTSSLEEITLEANPGDITADRIRTWQTIGINRLSIGIQSFNDRLLQLIGRRHTAQQAIQAVTTALAEGISNISIDLMYALPTQTMIEWQADIDQALQLNVPHISSYGLIYEDGTPLTQWLEQGKITAIDEELEMHMYDHLVHQLTHHGYEHYEVSNFALPGWQSKHNSSYWNDTPYLGLGAGAHSYDGKKRWWNTDDIDQYIQQATHHSLCPEEETLSLEDRHTEQVMLGLRTNKGVPVSIINIDQLNKYLDLGLLNLQGDHVVATTKGFHVLNRIIEDIL